MAKRTRTVFRNHNEVCHVWAQQRQEHGRAGNIFFDGAKIHSYRSSYLMAKIHGIGTPNVFAIFNHDEYSVSTAKHHRHARDALRGLMPMFSGVPGDISATVAYLDGQVKVAIHQGLSRKFFADAGGDGQLDGYIRSVGAAQEAAEKFRRLAGRANMRFPHDLYGEMIAHLKKLEDSYQARAPQRAVKRENARREREAREEQQRKKNAELYAAAISNFRSGKSFFFPWGIHPAHELLRFSSDGERVETSRGAQVPTVQARVLLAAIEAGKPVEGQRIGHYTLTSVEDVTVWEGEAPNRVSHADMVIRIGCHSILRSEARKLFGTGQSIRELA